MERIRALSLVPILLLAVAAASAGEPPQVGEVVAASLETPHPYPTSGRAEAAPTWVESVSWPGAPYVAVHFARLDLAPGDFVVVRSPDGVRRWIYRDQGKQGLGVAPGGFFAGHVSGDTAVVELFTVGDTSAHGLTIDGFARGYTADELRALWEAGLGEKLNLVEPPPADRSLCTADDTDPAVCYQVSEPAAYASARAVARLLINGTGACTGWLVGTEGHLMTNEHCIGGASDAANTDFEFMAEAADCGTLCESWFACPGTVEASGSTLVRVSAALDYALVVPDTASGTGTDLPGTYGTLRLRADGAVPDERLYIPQHPQAWGKRLAIASTYPADTAGYPTVVSTNEPPCSGGPGDVGYWADTQGGSSGSPVLAYDDDRVIALHHCAGSSGCASGTGSQSPNRGVPITAVIADLGDDLPEGSVCDPFAGPADLQASAGGDNVVALSWTPPAGSGWTHRVYRSVDGCAGAPAELVASGLTAPAFQDLTVSGGTTYGYVVTAVDPEGCESDPSGCAAVPATGLCTRAPDFAGLVAAENSGTFGCGVDLSWQAATGHCGTTVTYSVYRAVGEDPAPGSATLVASCLTGLAYHDATVVGGTDYHYLVRAEDDSGNGPGACAAGNQDGNPATAAATATGPDEVFFADDVEDGAAGWTAAAGPNDPGTQPWAVVTTDSASGTHSWFVAEIADVKDQVLATEAALDLTGVDRAELRFSHRFDTERTYDGGVLEYSTDGGATWFDILAGDGGVVPANADRITEGGYTVTLSTSYSNPLPGRRAWSGSSAGWSGVRVDLADFAGTQLRLRWRFGCDSSVTVTGWWIDDVRVLEGSDCLSGLLFADGFDEGTWWVWSDCSED